MSFLHSSHPFLKLLPLGLLCLIAFSFSTNAFALSDDSVAGDEPIPLIDEQQQQDAVPSAEKRVPHPFGWRQPGTGRVRSSFHPMSVVPPEFGGRRFNRFYDYAAPGRPLFIRYMRNFGN